MDSESTGGRKGALEGLIRPVRALQGPQGPYTVHKGLIRPLRALCAYEDMVNGFRKDRGGGGVEKGMISGRPGKTSSVFLIPHR